MPIDCAKETWKERQPLLWHALLLALGYSKPLCELSRALTALIRKEKIQLFLTPKLCWTCYRLLIPGQSGIKWLLQGYPCLDSRVAIGIVSCLGNKIPPDGVPPGLTNAGFLTYLNRRVNISFSWNLLIRTLSQLGSFESLAGMTNSLGQNTTKM